MSTFIGRHYRRKIVRRVVPFGSVLQLALLALVLLVVISYWFVAIPVCAIGALIGYYGTRSPKKGKAA